MNTNTIMKHSLGSYFKFNAFQSINFFLIGPRSVLAKPPSTLKGGGVAISLLSSEFAFGSLRDDATKNC